MHLSDVEQRLMYRLSRLTQALEAEFTIQAGAGAITPRQLLLLAAVAQSQGAIQTELVLRTNIDRSTMTELIKRMAKRGLLRRKMSETDSRAYQVYITNHGKEALAKGSEIALNAEKKFLSKFPSDIRAKLVSL